MSNVTSGALARQALLHLMAQTFALAERAPADHVVVFAYVDDNSVLGAVVPLATAPRLIRDGISRHAGAHAPCPPLRRYVVVAPFDGGQLIEVGLLDRESANTLYRRAEA